MKTLIAFAVCVCLASCYYPVEYISLRDVPLKPAVVVIPTSDYLPDAEFANMVESAIIRLGVSVIQRPGPKTVESTTNVGAGARTENERIAAEKVSGASVRETYFAFGETSADYVIFTYHDSGRIKVFKKSTRELLASFILSVPVLGRGSEIEKFTNSLYDPLVAVGLKVQIPVKR